MRRRSRRDGGVVRFHGALFADDPDVTAAAAAASSASLDPPVESADDDDVGRLHGAPLAETGVVVGVVRFHGALFARQRRRHRSSFVTVTFLRSHIRSTMLP
jgi:hypothetical protein